jgi:hypothetical protein
MAGRGVDYYAWVRILGYRFCEMIEARAPKQLLSVVAEERRWKTDSNRLVTSLLLIWLVPAVYLFVGPGRSGQDDYLLEFGSSLFLSIYLTWHRVRFGPSRYERRTSARYYDAMADLIRANDSTVELMAIAASGDRDSARRVEPELLDRLSSLDLWDRDVLASLETVARRSNSLPVVRESIRLMGESGDSRFVGPLREFGRGRGLTVSWWVRPQLDDTIGHALKQLNSGPI